MTKSEKLLIEIARCDNFTNCNGSACAKIVGFQKQTNKQLPEPWNGDIVNSPILFVSSNPSINENEIYPLSDWADNEIIDFFKNRFSGSKGYVKNSLYPKHKNGYAENWVRYWGFVRSISRKLLNRNHVLPGIDYSMMEIVRCKSHSEFGVGEALDTCAEKYLNKTLELSNAKVIITIGDKSRDILEKKLNLDFKENIHIKAKIGGVNRLIFATPHSNSRKKRTLEAILNVDSINEIQEILK